MKQRKRPRSGTIGDAVEDTNNNNVSEVNKPIQNIELKKQEIIPKPIKRKIEILQPAEKKKKTPPSLPVKLKQLGNTKAWADLIAHLVGDERHKPVLIHGPVGCGKTLGVQDCLKTCDINCSLLDGSAPENPSELDMWISQVRDNSVLEGEGGVLFIDDIESFTPQCREIIVKHIKKTSKSKSPLIITCTDFYAYDLKEFTLLFKNLLTIRLFQPNTEVTTKWLQTKGYSLPSIKSIVYDCKGDLRHSELLLSFFFQIKNYSEKNGKVFKLTKSTNDQKLNIFELSNSLLTRKNDKWFEIFSAQNTSSHTSHIRILYENLGHLLYEPSRINIKDPLEGYAAILDSFTHTDWNCLDEFIHQAGIMCQHHLGCRTVSKKWCLPLDKTNSIQSEKELKRNFREELIKKSNTTEKREIIKNFYSQIYENEKFPSINGLNESGMDNIINKINPVRLVNGNVWDIPSNLGGTKFN